MASVPNAARAHTSPSRSATFTALATEALVYQRENELSQAETALAVLLGRSPLHIIEGFSEVGKTLEELNTYPAVPGNLPSDLLERRPDIRAVEGTLMAANARIGAARAEPALAVSPL